jgi:hypothetical protein
MSLRLLRFRRGLHRDRGRARRSLRKLAALGSCFEAGRRTLARQTAATRTIRNATPSAMVSSHIAAIDVVVRTVRTGIVVSHGSLRSARRTTQMIVVPPTVRKLRQRPRFSARGGQGGGCFLAEPVAPGGVLRLKAQLGVRRGRRPSRLLEGYLKLAGHLSSLLSTAPARPRRPTSIGSTARPGTVRQES